MNDREPDVTALESCLQALNHLFIDNRRLEREPEYEEKRGGYGDVHVATLDPGTSMSKLVAAKTIRLRTRHKEPQRLAFRLARELRVWARLQHQHILPLLGYFLDKDYKKAVLVSEYMADGDLKDYIEQKDPSWDTRLQLIHDSTDGLAYLHGQNPPICHGDLKPGNVLINGEPRAMLADFGLSKALEDGPTGLTTSDGTKGTLRYNSPELMSDDNDNRSLASDIWAWACLALEALTDEVPYATKNTEPAIIIAVMGGEMPSDTKNLPIPIPDLRFLLAECWTSQPSDRPTADYCLRMLDSVLPASSSSHPTENTAAQQNSIQTDLWSIEPSANATTFGNGTPPRNNAGGDSRSNVEESKVQDAMDIAAEDLNLQNSVESVHAAPYSQPLIDWRKEELIGQGAYGPIHLARNVTTREKMAVKDVEITRYQRYRDYLRLVRIIKALENEKRILEKLDHPNIVRYLWFEQSEEFFSTFFEYLPGDSVGNRLRSSGMMEESIIKSLTGQILNGLAYLHQNKIIHGSVKANNIWFSSSGQCKICEFTRSQEREEVYKTALIEPIKGSVFWMAPEMLPGNLKGYSAKIDIWSLGCTVLEMFTGKRPWPGAEDAEVLSKVGCGTIIPPVPANVHLSAEANDFLLKCFTEDQDERPTAEGLKTHPWLTLPAG